MKNRWLAILLLASPLPSLAQSSVTLYGIVTEGMTYVSSQGGNSNIRLDSGTLMMSRFGLKGTEDLGNDGKAFFVLEQGFSATTGAGAGCLVGTCAFSRQAYVGLSHPVWGTLSTGLQTPTVSDVLGNYMGADMIETSYLSVHPGDYDQIFRAGLGNTIKYQSPDIAGLKLSATYNFGNVAGSFGQASQWSTGASYSNGPVSLGAAYLKNRGAFNPASLFLTSASNPFGPSATTGKSQTFGAGVRYSVAGQFVHLLFTQTNFEQADITARTYEAGYGYRFTPTLQLNVDWQYTDVAGRASLTSPVALLIFSLSKRTDLYAVATYEHVNGHSYTGAPLVASIFTIGDSSSNHQLVANVGIRHVF